MYSSLEKSSVVCVIRNDRNGWNVTLILIQTKVKLLQIVLENIF